MAFATLFSPAEPIATTYIISAIFFRHADTIFAAIEPPLPIRAAAAIDATCH